MKSHDLAAMSAFYNDDPRTTQFPDGTWVVSDPDTGQAWVVASDEDMYWGAWNRAGEQVEQGHDTPDEAIWSLIGDPR